MPDECAKALAPTIALFGGTTTPVNEETKRLALAILEEGNSEIWVCDPRRDAMIKLTSDKRVYSNPTWSPDGRYILFSAQGGAISWTRADGAGQPQQLLESKQALSPWSFSPDGMHLAYFELGSTGGQILTVSVTEENGQLKAGMPEPFFPSKFSNGNAEFSPDGRWLAYVTNESGQNEVKVRPFPQPASLGQDGSWQISNSGGTQPKWARNRRELLYQTGDRILAVSYSVNGNTFVAEKPRVLIEKLGGTDWDLAADGRIAILTPAAAPSAQAAEHTVVFLENFFDELRRRVQVK